jgi:hypothetical protein
MSDVELDLQLGGKQPETTVLKLVKGKTDPPKSTGEISGRSIAAKRPDTRTDFGGRLDQFLVFGGIRAQPLPALSHLHASE